jgi:hypothetical protein
MRTSLRHVAAAALGAALLAGPAAADWLVTKEGGRVETKGPWKIKGRLVVFTQLDGTLGSLRVPDVDLEASSDVTFEEMENRELPPPRPEPAPKKKSIRSLTDADFAKPEPAPAPGEEGQEGTADGARKPAAKAEGKPAGRPEGKVSIASWQRVDRAEKDGLEITGALRNDGGDIAAGLGVTVHLYDEQGNLVATGEGIPTTNSIKPQGVVNFRAAFPGVFSFADAKFDIRSWGLDLAPGPKAGDKAEKKEGS